MKNLTSSNIQSPKQIIKLDNLRNSSLDLVRFSNSTSEEDSLILIDDSFGIEINDISISNYSKLVLEILDSQLSSMTNIVIESCYKAMSIVRTSIGSIEDSTFINNGEESIPSGGAIRLFNSKVEIINSTFRSNTAIKGGAISFE